jgi:hypothetical protein
MNLIAQFVQQLVYCGHEYSIQNLSFGLSVEPDNDIIKKKLEWSKMMRQKDPPEPTVPSTIGNHSGTLEMLSGKLKDGLKMCISLRGARATGLCQIGKSSAPGIKQNVIAVRIMLLYICNHEG